ncbi:unnamed protein product, partial [Notodromas monacha]
MTQVYIMYDDIEICFKTDFIRRASSFLLDLLMPGFGLKAPSGVDSTQNGYNRMMVSRRKEWTQNYLRWIMERHVAINFAMSNWVGKGNLSRTRSLPINELNGTNKDKLEEVENIISSSARFELSPSEEEVLLGGEPVAQDDPKLVKMLRDRFNTTQPKMGPKRYRNKNLKNLEHLDQLHEQNKRAKQSRTAQETSGMGKKILDKYFNKTFHGKTFIDVGVHHNECWENVFNSEPMVNWTGLVIEMEESEIDFTLLTKVMPFCASNSNMSNIGLMKTIYFEEMKTVSEFNESENAYDKVETLHPVSLYGETTLLPLPFLADSFSEAVIRKNVSRVVFKPIPCFPLYSLMLAGEVTEPDYLAIGTGPYSGEIAESLPWSNTKLRPKVLRLADLGHDNSTLDFLKNIGYELDEDLSRFEPNMRTVVQHAYRPPDVAVRETFEWRLPDLDDDQTADSPEDKEVRDAMKRFWKLEHAKMAQGKEKGSSSRAVKEEEEEEENRLTSGFQCGDVTAYKIACIAFTAMYSCVLALHWKRDVNHWRNFAEQSRSITGMMTPVAQLSAPSGGLNSLSLSVATDFPYHQQYHVRYNPTPEVTLHNETADPGFIHHQHDEMAAASEVQRRSRSPTTLPSMSHSFYSSQNEIKGNNLHSWVLKPVSVTNNEIPELPGNNAREGGSNPATLDWPFSQPTNNKVNIIWGPVFKTLGQCHWHCLGNGMLVYTLSPVDLGQLGNSVVPHVTHVDHVIPGLDEGQATEFVPVVDIT